MSDAFARIDPEASENERRTVLARFLFRGNDVLRKICTLTGSRSSGEQPPQSHHFVFGRTAVRLRIMVEFFSLQLRLLHATVSKYMPEIIL